MPLEELYEACRDRARDPHRQARGRPGDRATVHRRARQLRAHAEPARLLARAEAAELPLAHPRRRARRCTASGRSATSSRAATSTSRIRRSRTSRASSRPSGSCSELDDGFIFVNLVETDMLWGHRNDPVNFHRCLQDFDRRLPDLLDALRPGDLLILTSDHGCDPTTPSTDHSREYAMLLAYVAGRNAAGRDPRGRVRRRRRDRQRVARRQGAVRAAFPGSRSSTPMKLDNPLLVRWEYASEERLRDAQRGLARAHRGRRPERAGVRRGRRDRAAARARGRLRPRASSRERFVRTSSAPRSSASTCRSAWSSSRARAALDARVGDVEQLPFGDGEFDCVFAGWMLYHVPGPRRRRSPSCARVLRPADASSRRRTASDNLDGALGADRRGIEPRDPLTFTRDERRGAAAPVTSRESSGVTSNGTLVFPDRDSMRTFVASTIDRAHLAPRVPEFDGAARVRRRGTSIFVAEGPR